MTEPILPGASLAPGGPQRWQIVQQDASGAGFLRLCGVYRTAQQDVRVEVRLVHERDGRPVAPGLDWQIADHGEQQTWSRTLDNIPSGGLYRLETRVWRGDGPDLRPMRGDYAHHLGVGDIWVIAGQSNASGTGLGFADDPPTLGVHLFGNDEGWHLACHPLEDATHSLHPITVHGVFQAHSPWLAFGRRLQARLGHPIGLIPTALGGSPLALWEPAQDGPLYANMRAMIRAAGGRVRGMVWYQGESDGNPAAVATYGERFKRFVATLRDDLGDPAFPVLCAQLGRVVAPGDAQRAESWTRLRELQRQLADELDNVWLIPAIDLPLSDEIHLSAASNVLLGERFAEQALIGVYGRAGTPPALRLLKAELRSPDSIRLNFTRSPAGWCRPGEIRSLTADDGQGPLGIKAVTVDDDGWVELRLARTAVEALRVHAHAGCHPPADLRDRDQRPVEAFSVTVPYPG